MDLHCPIILRQTGLALHTSGLKPNSATPTPRTSPLRYTTATTDGLRTVAHATDRARPKRCRAPLPWVVLGTSPRGDGSPLPALPASQGLRHPPLRAEEAAGGGLGRLNHRNGCGGRAQHAVPPTRPPAPLRRQRRLQPRPRPTRRGGSDVRWRA